MRQRFDQVLVFCPDAATGGAEALHQFADSINRQGGKARMVYTGPSSRYAVNDRVIECVVDRPSIALRAYRRYNPQVLTSAEITERTLLVFPEIKADLAWAMRSCLPCQVACWWLAVHDLGLTHDEKWCSSFVQNVIQMYQSQAALDQLRKRGALTVVPMYDYTDRKFVRLGRIHAESDTRAPKIARSIAYFPRKGGDMATGFFEKCGAIELAPIRIENMTKAQVMDALSSSQVYIDFGHQPGKDRVPREAAAVGNIVLLHRMGAAVGYLDHSIDEMYKFDWADIETGALRALVSEILKNPQTHRERQAHYRQKIALEQVEFDLQVRQFVFQSL